MKRPDTYHHGNLRQALLEAVRALINEAGVEKLTLRSDGGVTVTHAAVQHHCTARSNKAMDLLHASSA